MGETFQATSLHTPCGVEGMGTDVSTWGSCCVGLGEGCDGMGAAGEWRVVGAIKICVDEGKCVFWRQ